MKKVYLAGPIFGCSDNQANDWRNIVTEKLKSHDIETLNPMIRDYRGKEDENVDQIVAGDLADIKNSQAMLMQCNKPSWGTAMECMFAYSELDLPIVGFCNQDTKISPWLRAHTTDIVHDLDEAINKIIELLK